MMTRLLSYLIANIAGLLIAARYIPDFHVAMDWRSLALVALLLMFGNAVIRPILKFIFSFVVILTLGLFTVIINAAILGSVDFFSSSITITSIQALLYGTVIISIANFIVGGGIRLFASTSSDDA